MKDRNKTNMAQRLFIILCGIAMLLGTLRVALADVSVGDVIDKTNWQKAQGLLPPAMLEYLQKGYFTIKVGKLNYDPLDVLPTEYKASLQNNIGRYAVNNAGQLVDKKTGDIDPMTVIGIPFPELDVKDPQVPKMMGYNHFFNYGARGNVHETSLMHFVGKTLERSIVGEQMIMSSVGSTDNIAMQAKFKNFGKGELAHVQIMKVIEPYQLNGVATLSYSYNDDTPDKMFAYVPALRRVRTTSAAEKSKAMFGSDYALDDSCGGFMGKPRDFTCKYLRTQEGLVSHISPDLIQMFKNKDGSYELKKPYASTIWGFETPGWQGKPWAPTNHIWVKEKVHVIECMAKDPYYNYGKFELWYAPKMFSWVNKTVWDRTGKRWKVMVPCYGGFKSADNVVGKMEPAFGDWIYNEQRDHATCNDEYNSKSMKVFHAKLDTENFTTGGLVKVAK